MIHCLAYVYLIIFHTDNSIHSEFIIVFSNEPQDENVTIGMDAFFSCTVIENITMTEYIPIWKITTSGSSRDYHERDLELPFYTYNGSGLIVHNVNATADGSLYACCFSSFIPSEVRFSQTCSRAGRLNVIGRRYVVIKINVTNNNWYGLWCMHYDNILLQTTV